MGASFVNAAAIFGFAAEAYQRIADRHPPERAPDQREAIVAVVFAAAALEAFINELGALADHPPLAPAPESIKAFATTIKEVEGERGSVYLKFHVARWIFAGSVYPRGQEPFQLQYPHYVEYPKAWVTAGDRRMPEFGTSADSFKAPDRRMTFIFASDARVWNEVQVTRK